MSGFAPRSILLTGASGFVGRRLAKRLAAFAAPGARLTALGRREPPVGWVDLRADITDELAVSRAVAAAKPEVVVHLAAQSSVGAAREAAEATWRTNFGGSFALAVACGRHAPEAVVLYVSSAEVYGMSFCDGPVDEDAPMRPQNPYARSKAAAEQAICDVLSPSNHLIVARPFNHTGAGQDERFVLPSFAAQIARIEAGLQEPVMRVGNLDAERDFLHVEDVCDAYIALLDKARGGPAREVYNVSSATTRPVSAILDEMRSLSSARFSIEIDPARLRASDIPRASGHNERLRAATHWAAKISARAILDELLQSARSSYNGSTL